jgi:membrane protein EpsK
LAPLAINLSVIPLFSINTAYNKVKIPGLVSLVLGVANLLLAILLAKTFQLELYGIALAGAIILSAKNLVFTPLYAAHILSMKKITFYKFIIFSLITEVVSFILSFSISKIIAINTFFLLGVLVLGLVLFLIGFVWILLLNQQEKDIIKFNFMKVKSHEKIS